jgi:hypothetical protein
MRRMLSGILGCGGDIDPDKTSPTLAEIFEIIILFQINCPVSGRRQRANGAGERMDVLRQTELKRQLLNVANSSP